MQQYPVSPIALKTAHEWIPVERSSDGEDIIDLADVFDFPREHPWFNAYKNEDFYIDNPRTLGLHWDKGNIKPSHFIGAVNLPFVDKHRTFVVLPRKEFDKIDYGVMFAQVLATPMNVTGMDLDRLFGCDPEQAPIEGIKLPHLTLIEVTAFLATTARFVERHLRRGFVRIQENLVGRVRGRILITDQLRKNLAQARPDRMVCEYQLFSLDTLENRLLKAALEVSARYVSANGINILELQCWIRVIRSALASVPDHQPHSRDWSQVHNKGLMTAYAKPLALARLVLTRLHLKPTGEAQETYKTLPFFLDANRLFEGWVGVCLSDVCDSVWSQDWKSFGPKPYREKQYKFRPDFIVKANKEQQGHIVVDSKYKPDGPELLDLYQVLGYARLLAEPEPSLIAASGIPGGHGLSEACFAVPGEPISKGMPQLLERFKENWRDREGRCWGDGFRLTLVKVPLPRPMQ